MWFQNARAKWRRMNNSQGMSASGCPPSSILDSPPPMPNDSYAAPHPWERSNHSKSIPVKNVFPKVFAPCLSPFYLAISVVYKYKQEHCLLKLYVFLVQASCTSCTYQHLLVFYFVDVPSDKRSWFLRQQKKRGNLFTMSIYYCTWDPITQHEQGS